MIEHSCEFAVAEFQLRGQQTSRRVLRCDGQDGVRFSQLISAASEQRQ